MYGCGTHVPPPPTSQSDEPKSKTDGIAIESGSLTINAQSKSGERLWAVTAEQADANLGKEATTGELSGVTVRIFERDVESFVLTSPKATKTDQEYRLTGGTLLRSSDGNTRIGANQITGSPDVDRFDATGSVMAEFGGARLGPADSCTAILKSNKGEMKSVALGSLILSALLAQGTDIQLVDKAKDLHVSGASKLSVKGIEGNKVSVSGDGNPITADWKLSGLRVSCRNLVATLIKGDTYTLDSGTASGGVTAVVTEKDGTLTLTSNEATFTRSERTLTFSGGVHVVSKRDRMPADLHADRIVVHLSATALNAGKYEVEKVSATGNGLRLTSKLESGTATVEGATRIELTPRATRAYAFDASGANLIVRFSPDSLDAAPSWTATAPQIEGELQASGDLSSLGANGGVRFKVNGVAKSEKWDIDVTCGDLNYERSTSVLKLNSGVTMSGSHPALAGGGATLTAKRAEVEFKKDTLEPVEVRLFGGNR